MDKKERVRAAVAGEPVDRVPVGLWGHDYLRESFPRELVDHTVESYRKFDWDFVKFNPRATYFGEAWGNVYGPPDARTSRKIISPAVKAPAGLRLLQPVDEHTGVFGDHLFALRLLVDELGSEVDIIHTIFSPMSVAAMLCGAPSQFVEFAGEDPAAAHAAVGTVTQTLLAYGRASLAAGAAGIFFAPLEWSSRDTCSDEFYREFGRPYDLQIIDAVRGAEFNVLHVCRERNRIDMLWDYPVAAINWADRGDGNPSLADVRRHTNHAVMGGVDHVRIPDMTEAQVLEETREAIRTVPSGLLLGSSCSIKPWTPEENKRAVVLAARGVA